VAVLGLALHEGPAEPSERRAAASHFLLPAMAVSVSAAVAFIAHDWRVATVAQAVMGGAYLASTHVTVERVRGRERPGHEFLHDAAAIGVLLGAFLAILAGVPNLAGKIVLIAGTTFLVAYESFVDFVGGEHEALFYSQTVAVVTTAIGFGLIFSGILGQSYIAAILVLVWYVERGVIVHVLSRTMTRTVAGEYAVIAILCLVLIANALINH
jgi:hypothetical protein